MATSDLLPSHCRFLSAMGENIKMAWLLGRLSAAQVGERANITRATLYNIEKELDIVNMGAYFSVLVALRLENDILLLAKDDCWDVNNKIQDWWSSKGHPKEKCKTIIGRINIQTPIK